MRKLLICAALFIAGFAAAVLLTHGTLSAQSSINDADLMAKLDTVVKGQEEVVAAINSIKDDIQIIKVRVTQLQ